jgi:amino acid transporter
VLGILLSIFVSALIASYAITIGCMLLHRLQNRKLPYARYSLRWGVAINIVALLYIAPIFIFSFFPSTSTPTPATMNWAVVMVAGPIILVTSCYIVWGRKSYTPPEETVEDYIVRHEATTETGTRQMAAEDKFSDVIVEKSATDV